VEGKTNIQQAKVMWDQQAASTGVSTFSLREIMS